MAIYDPTKTPADSYDTHTHLNDDKLYHDVDAYIGRANEFRVMEMNIVGYDAVVGEEGFVRFNTAASSTGKAKGDAALMTFTMTAEQVELVRGLSGISGATVPATTAVAIAAELIAATSV